MADAIYTIQPEDVAEGLTGIARRLYGDERRWSELYEANLAVIGLNPTLLQAGQQLLVSGLAERPPATCVYTIQPPDLLGGLRGIARRLLGDEEGWAQIYAVNRGVIGDDPLLIRVGQRLIVLPCRAPYRTA